ncbi:MAG: type II secretion system protein [Planctomycetia bacterium]|nr:type II secretion system protein [Planctomycetia bacterium]
MTNADKRGFTLLEILIVLAVLGMGLAIISMMMKNSATYSGRVKEETNVQLVCDSMMSSILSGNMTATLGVELPVPDEPNWTTKVELVDGPLESIVAVKITARRYETPAPIGMGIDASGEATGRVASQGRRFAIKEYARRANVQTRVVKIGQNGETTTVDGTGETVAQDMAQGVQGLGGGLGGASLDPNGSQFGDQTSLFDSLSPMTDAFGANGAERSASPLGGGSLGASGFSNDYSF